jgi:hypothetical protein
MDSGVKVKLHAFSTSALDESEWPVLHSGRFIPGAWARGSRWIWVTLKGDLGEVGKESTDPGRPVRGQTPVRSHLSEMNQFDNWRCNKKN